MTDAVIIGAGLFGSIIARELRYQGVHVTVIDDKREGSGSSPAACLMKPSWFSSLGYEYYAPALETLDRLYGLREVAFNLAKVKWIPPSEILIGPDITGRVIGIVRQGSQWIVHLGVDRIPAQYVIIAAGIWCNQILSGVRETSFVPGLATRQGIAFVIPNHTITKPFIRPWAPYKQLVGFNVRPNTGWVSDGTAVKQLPPARVTLSHERCKKAIEDSEVELFGVIGNRPYTPHAKPCYLQQHHDDLWVVTGGAKNGTIAAGWAAHELGRRIG